MRLFTGISVTPQIADGLEAALIQLRPLAAVNWTPPENFHVTMKFIGLWPEERLAELRLVLEAVPAPPPFEITIADFGFYPNPRKPRVLFAGVSAPAALTGLAASIDEALGRIGGAREQRPYSPHLTLARIKDQNIGVLRERITSMQTLFFGTFEVAVFHLYLSKPAGRTSVYTKLASYPLPALPGIRA